MNNLESKYELLLTYNQKQEDFDTIFEYHLENEEAIKIAKDGLNDLKNTAPVTLSTQCKNISSIEIINEIDNEICKYTISNKKLFYLIFFYFFPILTGSFAYIKIFIFPSINFKISSLISSK